MSLILRYHYQCIRCEYVTEKKSNMQNHLVKKKKCNWINEDSTVSDEEVFKKSCMKVFDNVLEIKEQIEEKKKELELEDEQTKKMICTYCTRIFTQKISISRHMQTCRMKQIVEPIVESDVEIELVKEETVVKSDVETEHIIHSIKEESPTMNVSNHLQIIDTQNVANIANINLALFGQQHEPVKPKIEKSMTRSFKNGYDISHISDLNKSYIMMDCSYNKMLKNVFENSTNCNHVFLNDHESYIYESEEKGYVIMDKEQISQRIVEKAKYSLNLILNEMKDKKILRMGLGSMYNFYTSKLINTYKYYLSNEYSERKLLNDSIDECFEEHKETFLGNFYEWKDKQEMIKDKEETEALIKDTEVTKIIEKSISSHTEDVTTYLDTILYEPNETIVKKIDETRKSITESVEKSITKGKNNMFLMKYSSLNKN